MGKTNVLPTNRAVTFSCLTDAKRRALAKDMRTEYVQSLRSVARRVAMVADRCK